jgi:N utilization substance protein B
VSAPTPETKQRARQEARHRAREVALQALFAVDLQRRPSRDVGKTETPGDEAEASESTPTPTPTPMPTPSDAEPIPPAEVFAGIAANFEMPKAAHDFAQALALNVVEQCAELDRVIAEHASNWRVERMAVVDRNILRLASWELLFSDTPAAVVIDEAVELARRFGADTTPAFVNGVLDAVARRADAAS